VTPPVLLLQCRSDGTPAYLNCLRELLPESQIVLVSAVPVGPLDLRREAALVLAAGLARRGVPALVVGDLGIAVERDSLCLHLAHQGLTAAVIEDGGHGNGTWPTLTVTGQELSAVALTTLLEEAHRSRAPRPGAEPGGYVVLLRHGHASYPGAAFPSPGVAFPSDMDLVLTPRGVAQARAAGLALRSYAPAVIYSSALLRARQTAGIVAEMLGGTPIVYDARLNEREFTPLHGLTPDLIAQRHGTDFLSSFTTTPDEVILDGVESMTECQARVVKFFDDLPEAGAERPLVVAHGGPFAWLASFAMGLSLDKSRRWHMAHAGLSTMAAGPPLRLISWNARWVDPEGYS
jgi:broad specificity phosphatase PhoE